MRLRLLLFIILKSEDKTSKNEVDTSRPNPHSQILEVPDGNREDSTEVISDRDEVRERFLRERLKPILLKATRISCCIDRDNHEKDKDIVWFESPEYDEKDSRYDKKPVKPI